MFFKKIVCIAIAIIPCNVYAQRVQKNWVLHHPFEQKVFIENNEGQFDKYNGYNSAKVLYSAELSGVLLCFTPGGIIYRYDEYPNISHEEREKWEHDKGRDERDSVHVITPQTYYFMAQWNGANPNVQVVAEDEVSYYYCYSVSSKPTIIAHAFKKLLYKNIYPSIDIEYRIPADKNGIEYAVIVHPGADLSDVKLVYSGVQGFLHDASGNIMMQSSFGQFVDHAPTHVFYKENNEPSSAAFTTGDYSKKKHEVTVSFGAGSYNQAKTLVIDPWVTNPSFAGRNAAYDLCYDNNGNVYIYGGCTIFDVFSLAKVDALGTIQWIFQTSFPDCLGYGDVAVDKATGTSYIGDAVYSDIGPIVYKVNSSGIKTDTVAIGVKMAELWRMEYNQCMNNIVIAGGNPFTPSNSQATVLSTGLGVVSSVNVLGVYQGYHDMALLSIDNTGNYSYMASAMQPGPDSMHANNTLLKCPLPSLSPNVVFTPDGYRFSESANNYYVNSAAIGMNGMTNSPNWVYLYDGYTLSRFNKLTGALIAKKSINPPKYNAYKYIMLRWGGIDVTDCDNVYIGDKNQVDVIDSSFSITGTIPMDSITDTVYDLHLAPGNHLYACGDGFVASYTVASPSLSLTISKTPACSGCNGTATAWVSGCGNKNSTYSYQWSNGQTTQSATGLCAGNYTVNVLSHCEVILTDTVNIVASSNAALNITANQVNEKCYGQSAGSASVSVTGGSGIYAYLWAPSGDTVPGLSGLSAGTYAVTITDTNGCAGIVSFTITEPTALFSNITTINDSCYGEAIGVAVDSTSGGKAPYKYIWQPGGVNGATDSGLAAGNYSVTITDSNGCTLMDSVSITQAPQLTLTDSVINAQCYGLNNGGIYVTVNGGTPAYLYFWTPAVGTMGSATGLTAGSYICAVEDYHRCIDTISAVITQPAALTIVATASPASNYMGSQVTLSSTASGGVPPYNYVWSNGENGQSITVSPYTTTSYTVTVYDSAGCVATGTVTGQVENCPPVFVPNVFSPNGDGQNDVLYVREPCLKTMDFVIYDRWGNKVFESSNINVGWDGKYKGSPEDVGTYVYYLRGTYTDGTSFEKKGNVTLLR